MLRSRVSGEVLGGPARRGPEDFSATACSGAHADTLVTMIRHVVLLEFLPGTPKEHVDGIAAGLRDLPNRLPGLRSYEVGSDMGLAAGNAHLAVLAAFDDVDAYLEYRDDPVHRRIIAEQILPRLASRSASQFDDTAS